MNNISLIELEHWIGASEEANWNEYITEHVAKGVIPKLSIEDWKFLKSITLSKPNYWQQRLAVSLGENGSKNAIDLLKRLLYSNFVEVQIMAACELAWAETPIEKDLKPRIIEIINEVKKIEGDNFYENYSEILELLEK